MRVGVDATSWVSRRGYGRFARNAFGRLVALDRDATYVFVIDEESARTAELTEGAEKLVVALAAAGGGGAGDSYRPPADLLRVGFAASRARFDALVFPSVYTYFPSVGVPSIVGVHDLIAADFPELTLPSRRARAFWEVKQRTAVRLARGCSPFPRRRGRALLAVGRAGGEARCRAGAADPVFAARAEPDQRGACPDRAAGTTSPARRRRQLHKGVETPRRLRGCASPHPT
jgi:hypothetical protein